MNLCGRSHDHQSIDVFKFVPFLHPFVRRLTFQPIFTDRGFWSFQVFVYFLLVQKTYKTITGPDSPTGLDLRLL